MGNPFLHSACTVLLELWIVLEVDIAGIRLEAQPRLIFKIDQRRGSMAHGELHDQQDVQVDDSVTFLQRFASMN